MLRSVVVVLALAGTVLVMEPSFSGTITYWVGTPDAPAPSECRITPRSPSEVRTLIGTPEPLEESGGPIALPATLPPGRQAGEAMVSAARTTVRELLACENGHDVGRLYALYSDDLLRRSGPQVPEAFAALATPAMALPPTERVVLIAIRDVRILTDGRVRAVVDIGNRVDGHPAPGRTAFYVFARNGDRWLIDDVIDRVAQGDEIVYVADLVGTPTPQ